MNRTTSLVVALALAACGSSPAPQTTPAPPAMPPTTDTPPATPPVADKPMPPPAAPNPFLTDSTLYLQAPPFDKIHDDQYMPAFQQGMAEHDAEVRKIADNTEPPTFDNTIVAMERSGRTLTRVAKVFFNLAQSTTNPTIQKLEGDLGPMLAKHQDAINLDPKLFARIHSLYQQRDKLGLDPISVRLLERYHLDMVRGGAQLSDADKTTLRGINEEISKLEPKFSEDVLAETNDGATVVDDVKDLDGMSDSDIAAAAAAATARGLTGKWVIPMINTTQQPALSSLKNRALREKIFKASSSRGTHGNDHDTRQIVARLAQLRAQKAKLLGFSSWASYVLDDQMAKSPDRALALLKQIGPGAVKRAKSEIADMQAVIDKEKGGFKLQPWDWAFYAEKVRKAKYDLDDSQIRPYFELDHVLKDGVFYAANKLYGITVKQRTDLPVYDPDVRVWEIFDADGSTIGLFYTDYYARPSKHGGAWMDSFVDQSDLLGGKPVIVNVLNIPKPPAGQPALLTFDEVTTMFHEFGHGLHGLFSKVKYPYMSGTSTPRDFVEFPSQFNENWALEPSVFANYAKHYQTGAAMPAELVAKIKKASTFNQGFDTLETLEAQLVDLEWHALPATAELQDPEKFEAAALKKYGVDLPQVPPRYHTPYFQHIWNGGYSAGYYAYMWTAVLASDAFAWFTEHGGMTAANGKTFRDAILSRGGTVDAHDLYVKFRGHEPAVGPLLKKRGLGG
nr:M3 family metallopeptidase [Kofleriaceae bacterium]